MNFSLKFNSKSNMGYNSVLPPGYSGKFTTSHFNTYSSTLETCFMTNLKTGMHTPIKGSSRKFPTEGMGKTALENQSMSVLIVGGFVGSKSQAGGSSHRGRVHHIWDIIRDKIKGHNGYRENEYPSIFLKKSTDYPREVSSDLKMKETNKDTGIKFPDVTAASSECFLAVNCHKFTEKQFQINEPKGSLRKSQSNSSVGWECPLIYEKERTPDSILSNCPKTNIINAPLVPTLETPSENQPSNMNSELMPDKPDELCTARTLENRKIYMSEEMGVTSFDLITGVSTEKLPTVNNMVTHVKNQCLDSESSDSDWSFCSDCPCDSDIQEVRTLSDCSVDSDDSFIIFDGTDNCDKAQPNSNLSNFPKTDTINAPSVPTVELPSENQPTNKDTPDVKSELMPDKPDELCIARILENRKIHMSEEMGVAFCGVSTKTLLTENKIFTHVKNQRLDSESSDSDWSFCSDSLWDDDTKRVRTLSDCSIDSDDSFIVFDGTNHYDESSDDDMDEDDSEDVFSDYESSEDDSSEDDSSEDDSSEDDSSEDDSSEDDSPEDDGEKLGIRFISIEFGSLRTPHDNYLRAVNTKWNRYYTPTDEKPKKMSSKKVTFASDEDLVVWSYTDSQRSNWEQEILDRLRFLDRIKRVEQILYPILEANHRQLIYNQRFNNG